MAKKFKATLTVVVEEIEEGKPTGRIERSFSEESSDFDNLRGSFVRKIFYDSESFVEDTFDQKFVKDKPKEEPKKKDEGKPEEKADEKAKPEEKKPGGKQPSAPKPKAPAKAKGKG